MWTLRELVRWDVFKQVTPGEWVPARPERGPWTWRLRDAWAVLTGRADAFTWPEDDRG